MIRLFAALSIPEEIAEGLMRRQAGLPGATWRPREAFHITLRFFGEVAEPVADDIDSALQTVSGPPLHLSLARVGSFGEGDHMDAVWAGVDDSPPLARLAARCEAAARRAGLAPNTRAYRPHVTLAYLRKAAAGDVAAGEQANNLLRSPEFTVASFGLYSSQLIQGGSRYRLERSYPLDQPG